MDTTQRQLLEVRAASAHETGLGISTGALAGGAAQRRVQPAAMEGHYPHDRFIVGIGVAGVDRLADAERAARAEVARQVGSSIESSLELMAQELITDAHTSYREHRAQQIREQATFQHAELIHIDRSRSGCDHDGCWAVAVLERSLALAELEAKLHLLASSHAAAVDETLASTEDLVVFTPRWRRAQALYERLLAVVVSVRAIARNEPMGLADSRTAQRRMEDARERLLASVSIVVWRPELASNDAASVATMALVSALREAGVQVTEGTECNDALGLRTATELRCRQEFVGHICEAHLRTAFYRCEDASLVRETEITGWQPKGIHPTSEQRAIERLVEAARRAPLHGELASAVGDVIPL